MFLATRSPTPELSLQRKRGRGLHINNLGCEPASKRHQIATTWASSECVDETFIPDAAFPTQPTPPNFDEHVLEEIHSDRSSESRATILVWLNGIPQVHRSNSAPARLSGRNVLADADSGSLQQPFFQTIPTSSSPSEMMLPPLPRRQSLAETSVTSGRSLRATFGPVYRDTLEGNGVRIDYQGKHIPIELKRFLENEILKAGTTTILPEDISTPIATVSRVMGGSEGKLHELLGTAMFPIRKPEVDQGVNTMWSTEPLPRKVSQCDYPLNAPKPDVHLGYPMSNLNHDEKKVVNHQKAFPYARPTKDNCFPFLVMEVKSEATGGTLFHAENQAAGSGTHCVSSLRWVLQQAYPLQQPSLLDAVAFSISFNHRQAIYHVHFYSEKDNMHYMSWIGTFSTFVDADIKESNNIIQNIQTYGLGPRQRKIKAALRDLASCYLERWNSSRPASEMDAEEENGSEALAEGQSSNKHPRTQ